MKNMHTSGVYFAVFVAIFAGALADDDGPSNLCTKVPETIIENLPPDGFWPWELPAKDDLDQFMINKTGCEYVPLKPFREHKIAQKIKTPFQLNFAVRGLDIRVDAIVMQPFDYSKYYILGPQGLTKNEYFMNKEQHFSPMEQQSTPDIIGESFYTPFYFKLDAETMQFGKICDTEPKLSPFSHNVAFEEADVEIRFTSPSNIGKGASFIFC